MSTAQWEQERRLRKRMIKLVGEIADFGFDTWPAIRSLAYQGFCEWRGKKIRERYEQEEVVDEEADE